MASKEQAQSAVAEKTEPRVSEKDADVTYNLLKSHGEDVVLSLDVTAEKRLDRKLYFMLVPLLLLINLLLFVSRLSYTSV
jgi:hypothetical protein